MLFTPLQVGPLTLKHRVVMAPLTRSRAEQPGDVPGDLMRTYYAQRASDGGLIIAEATSISIGSRGWFGAPGLYSEAQVRGWAKITAAVHQTGGFMFSQLWHTGRSAHVELTGGVAPGTASVDPTYWLDPSHRHLYAAWLDPAISAPRACDGRAARDRGRLQASGRASKEPPASTASNCTLRMVI